MSDIDGIAKTKESDCNTRDIPVGNSIDMLALDTIGLDVETTVEVVWPWLTEVPRQRDFVVHWTVKD